MIRTKFLISTHSPTLINFSTRTELSFEWKCSNFFNGKCLFPALYFSILFLLCVIPFFVLGRVVSWCQLAARRLHCWGPVCNKGLVIFLWWRWSFQWCELRPWTAPTNGSVVHPPGDMWAWRTVVDDIDKEKLPIRSSHLVQNQEDLAKEMMNLAYEMYFIFLRIL
jgi:hypothetical protein